MTTSPFHQLLDEALSEITRRDADFISKFPLTLPQVGTITESSHNEMATAAFDPSVLDSIRSRASSYFVEKGALVAERSGGSDPVSVLLFSTAVDAYSSEIGSLALLPGPKHDASIAEIIKADYDVRVTPGGRRYLVRRHGRQPLLIVSALGVPLHVWSRLLSDRSHDLKVIVPENRCGDLLSGGMTSDARLDQHADDLGEVLADLDMNDVNVLGWCNGGRIAIELALRQRSRVRSLTLLSITLRGATDGVGEPSKFEENLQLLFTKVLKNNGLAAMMARTLPILVARPDWNKLTDNASDRADALFRLPAREHAELPLVPMSSGEFFLNYARRTAADESFPIGRSLAQLAESNLPVLVLTGDHDNIVSNAWTLSILTAGVGAFVHADIAGAGHYAQTLQYPYFIWMLLNFIETGQVPATACRVRVRQHGFVEA